MVKKVVWVCDGCQRELDTSEDFPVASGWKMIRILISDEGKDWAEMGKGRVDTRFHLCRPCVNTFHNDHVPGRWKASPVGRVSKRDDSIMIKD